MRVVFDGPSINECLQKGPNLVPNLFDTIIKFRGYPIGIVADIEKAFHQIQIMPADGCMLRFLWFDDPKKGEPKIRKFPFCRLVFGLTPSPAILATIIQRHLSMHQEREPEMVSLLNDSFCVDDFAGGAQNDDDALNVYEKAQALMKDGGFTLRKWTSNSKAFRERVASSEQEEDLQSLKKIGDMTNPKDDQSINSISKDDQLQNKVEGNFTTTTTSDKSVKILGLNWNIESDEFYFDPIELLAYAASLLPTKRSVLKLSAKIFDPIGILTPFTINMKCLFQTLCTDHVDWDTELDGKSLTIWRSLLKDLQAIRSINVPRCYFTRSGMITNQEIHGFCDASERAFAAVVYLRTKYEDGTIEVNLVSSKTRVAPLKRQSIPRLELLGANVLARLVNSVLKAISSIVNKPKAFLWTDSYTTLCWIKNNKIWKQYIQRRVKEIRQLTGEDQWNFCPGERNAADLPSRGCSGSNEKWFHGPEFLKHPPNQWPKSPHQTSLVNEIALAEAVKVPPTVTHNLLTLNGDDVPFSNVRIGMVMDCSKHSTLTKVLRVTELVLRFIRKLKRQKTGNETTQELTADDLKEAEMFWISHIQATSFPEEIRRLSAKQCEPNQLISQLNLFLDKNKLIRCEGRLEHSALPTDAKTPVLLPSRHHLTDLIIRNRHEIVHHGGIKDTLNCVRDTYWVLRGPETV